MCCAKTATLPPTCARQPEYFSLSRVRAGHSLSQVGLPDSAGPERNPVSFNLEPNLESRLFRQSPRVIGLHQTRIEFLRIELASEYLRRLLRHARRIPCRPHHRRIVFKRHAHHTSARHCRNPEQHHIEQELDLTLRQGDSRRLPVELDLLFADEGLRHIARFPKIERGAGRTSCAECNAAELQLC